MANEIMHFPPDSSSIHIKYMTSGSVFSGDFGVGWFQTIGVQFASGAIRLTNVQIPKNQTGINAALYLYADQRNGSAELYFKVWGVDEDSPGTGDPFGRTKTTASNTHNMNPSEDGYFVIGVGSIMEEIVARSGWSPGNSMQFIIEDNGTTTGSGDNFIFDTYHGNPVTDSFLSYRIGDAPNFKPTPKSVSAPSFPTAQDVGMKFSNPGVSVFDATDDQTYLTTRKRQFKIFAESYYQSVSGDVSAGFKAIAHNLGYVPFVSVYVKSSVFGGGWKRLPVNWAFEDHPAYGVDNTYLYLHSAIAGEEFYYRIFLDRIL